MRLTSLLTLIVALVAILPGLARADDGWQDKLGRIAVQEAGRVMPLDTYARRVAVELTGRAKWAESRGPEAFAGREAVELFADLVSRPEELWNRPLIPIDYKELKAQAGLDPERRFFSAQEIMQAGAIHGYVSQYQERRAQDSNARPKPLEKHAMEAQSAAMNLGTFLRNRQFAMVPQAGTPNFATIGTSSGHPGTEDVQAAFNAFQGAYLAGGDVSAAVDRLATAIDSHAPLPPDVAKRVRLEHFYNHHKPWLMAAIASLVALLLLLARWVLRLKLFAWLAAVAIVWAIAEQVLGLYLRISILGRAPVSNTYEALLWIGIVATLCGVIGQWINRKSWYLAGGLTAALVSLLFAQLVPLTDQTNALPPVLRSNYWLIIHVLTIVASYGAFLLAAVLGHAYLIRDVLLRRPADPQARLIVQTYRLMQLGLVLLTAGTILGGVWAAESWGRFWGWDPKETWSLISIVVYFVMLHARYSRWIQDFGLAVASIVGFLAIVWTFYGVNYVMATGLHSYGFGDGGEVWVGAWAAAELVFLTICFIRKKSAGDRAPAARGFTPPAKDAATPQATA